MNLPMRIGMPLLGLCLLTTSCEAVLGLDDYAITKAPPIIVTMDDGGITEPTSACDGSDAALVCTALCELMCAKEEAFCDHGGCVRGVCDSFTTQCMTGTPLGSIQQECRELDLVVDCHAWQARTEQAGFGPCSLTGGTLVCD